MPDRVIRLTDPCALQDPAGECCSGRIGTFKLRLPRNYIHGLKLLRLEDRIDHGAIDLLRVDQRPGPVGHLLAVEPDKAAVLKVLPVTNRKCGIAPGG